MTFTYLERMLLPVGRFHPPIGEYSCAGCDGKLVLYPATIRDCATFEKPHQYAKGMEHVFVNSVQVLRSGEYTGAKPGRVVRGPGWAQNQA